MNLVIKSATRDNLLELERFLPTNIPNFHQSHTSDHEKGTADWLIAYADDVPVGHFLVRWDGAHNDAVKKFVQNCPHLESGGVKEEFRRQGVATRMILAAEEMARQKGFTKIGMAVGANDNPRARHLYESLGYTDWQHGTFDESWQVIGPDGNIKQETETCIYLIKNLDR